MYLDSIEISATDHCNLSCAQCNHASPHLARSFADTTSIARDLDALATVIRAGELRIAGGEPLLHPDLDGLIGAARQSGITSRIVVITNGTLLHRVDWGFLHGIDELRISCYPRVSQRFVVADLQAACDAADVLLHIRDMPSFTRTMLTRRNEHPCVVRFIYRHCSLVNEWSCHLVHEGRFYKCTTAAFMSRRLAQAGIDHFPQRDAVSLHGNPDLGGELLRYMASKAPLESCAYCLGTVGATVRSRQLARTQLRQELGDDHVDAVAAMGGKALWDSLVLSPLRRMIRYRARMRARRRTGDTS